MRSVGQRHRDGSAFFADFDSGLVEGRRAEADPGPVEFAVAVLVVVAGHQMDGYWNGERKQARYREILDLESGTVGDAAEPAHFAEDNVPAVLEVLSGMGEIGAQFAEENRDNGAKLTLETMEDMRVGILADMGVTAEEVASAFDGLGDNVRAAVYREFASAYVPQQPATDPADLETFAESGAGRILVGEWGDDAGRKLATALYRWERTVEGLSDAEFAELDDFYRLRLRPQERAAVLRRLAA